VFESKRNKIIILYNIKLQFKILNILMLRLKSTYDILTIDKNIKNALIAENFEKIKDIEKNVNNIDIVISRYSDSILLSEYRKKIKNDINSLMFNEPLMIYVEKTKEFIDKYSELLKSTITISFVRNNNSSDISIKLKANIISDYLKIARLYADIEDAVEEFKNTVITCICGSEDNFSIDEYSRTCNKCGYHSDIHDGNLSYDDVGRINTSSKYSYDQKIHFKNTVYQYQAKQNTVIKPHIYNMLEEKFKMYKLLSNSSVRCEKYKRITKEHIYTFLKETGNPKHYDDIMLIYCKITGKSPPNISHIEEELFRDHEEIIKTDLKIKMNDRKNIVNDTYDIIQLRKSALNCKYLLLQLLLKKKIKHDIDDFNILKTDNRLKYHNDKCKEIFDILEWNFTEI
jgi:hypothetical protein